MKVMTERFGEVEINQDDIITFPKGILGMEQYKQYILINPDENVPFMFMQSIEDQTLCFLLLHTFSYFPDYNIELPESATSVLDISSPEEATVLTIVNAKDSLIDATTNLQAPIIINNTKKIGKQVLLETGNYLIKQPLITEK